PAIDEMAIPTLVRRQALVEKSLLHPRKQVVQLGRPRPRGAEPARVSIDATLQVLCLTHGARDGVLQRCEIEANCRSLASLGMTHCGDELVEPHGVTCEPERQRLLLAQHEGDRTEKPRELCTTGETRIRNLFDESTRVVIRVIWAVRVSARRVVLDRQRRKPKKILKRHEVRAA